MVLLLAAGLFAVLGCQGLLSLQDGSSYQLSSAPARDFLGSVRGTFAQALGKIPFAHRAQERRIKGKTLVACERDMPEFLDVLSLGLEAGLSFDASLALFCARSQSPLSRELQNTMQIWQMGLMSRSEALQALSQRVGAVSLKRFCSSVCEALSFGLPLASTLEHQADLLREEQRAHTQERIEEVPVRMLIPLGLLVVPAMLLAILGPLLASSF